MCGIKKEQLRFFLVILTCAISKVSISQNLQKNKETSVFVINVGDKLLYYVNNLASNNNEFLIPFIESELKSMVHKDDLSSDTLFQSVQGLNFYLAGLETNNTLLTAINRIMEMTKNST